MTYILAVESAGVLLSSAREKPAQERRVVRHGTKRILTRAEKVHTSKVISRLNMAKYSRQVVIADPEKDCKAYHLLNWSMLSTPPVTPPSYLQANITAKSQRHLATSECAITWHCQSALNDRKPNVEL